MWRSGWILVPREAVPLVVDPGDEDIEPWDYPSVYFMDGEVEGSDLNALWWLVHGSPTEPLWLEVMLDGPDGCEKIAPIRHEAIEAFADLTDAQIRDLAAHWQRAMTEQNQYPWWKLDEIVRAIYELACIARLERHLRVAWQLLMVWFV